MIFGIGVDVLESGRIVRTLERFGTRFIEHLLMPEEHAQLARTQRRERFLAMRFAAKEAIVKAMGTGFDDGLLGGDRKSTRLNSSHSQISYAVFCLKKKKEQLH